MLDILIMGNEVLRAMSAPVSDIDDAVRDLAAAMLPTMVEGRGVGLAAPQIGRNIRLFVTGIEGDKPRVFINPQLIRTSEALTDFEEGCLSIPGLYAELKRPEAVTIQAWNEKGRPFTLDAEGFLARVIQHEMDHLDGKLFVDHLPEMKRARLISQWEKRMRA